MSKNTSSNAFRKIDVDQFNEDNFKDDDGTADSNLNSSNFRHPNEVEINNLLNVSKTLDALKLMLQVSPGSPTDPVMALMMRILLSVKQNQVESIVKELDNDQRDVLMKYVYKGFEIPSEGSSAQLLIWHEKVFEHSGVGSIVRVLTDRKRTRVN